MKLSVVVLCAGESTRFGQDKMRLPIGAETVAQRTVHAFASFGDMQRVVVAPSDAVEEYRVLFADCTVVAGGKTRADSVRNALKVVDAPYVLIHDGARPLVGADLIARVIEALETHPAVVPVVGVTDSMMGPNGYLDRQDYRLVQTPQGFRTDVLRECFARDNANYTDEGALVARYYPVHTVSGDAANRKITHPIDYRGMAGERMVGVGYDIHRLCKGRALVLCGLTVPHDKGLMGHSDADCCLHAIMDAALSACALPDIGHYFPTTPQWKDADSADLLRIVMHTLAAQGARIAQVSLYIVAEEPKLSPYMEAMRQRLAELLSIPLANVGVGVTTNEQVPMRVNGMVTGEAIAAFATVTVYRG